MITVASSLLQHWNFTIGPFDEPAPAWLSKELPPEKDLTLAGYPFRGEDVKRGGVPTHINYMAGTQVLEKDKSKLAAAEEKLVILQQSREKILSLKV